MPTRTTRSRQIRAIRATPSPSTRSAKDAKFLALLRRKCLQAAGIGALTAAAESLPGVGKALRLAFGELLDIEVLAQVQRELIEETFALYGLQMPATLQIAIVRQIQIVGAGASVAGDTLARGMLRRTLGRFGTLLTMRAAPVAAVLSSTIANTAVTYAIGKRAQAIARLGEAPIRGMPDAVRAFTGIDERRIFAWSLAAAKTAIGSVSKAAGRVAAIGRGKPAKNKPPRRARNA